MRKISEIAVSDKHKAVLVQMSEDEWRALARFCYSGGELNEEVEFYRSTYRLRKIIEASDQLIYHLDRIKEQATEETVVS